MNKPISKLFIILAVLLTACSSPKNSSSDSANSNDDSSKEPEKEYNYQCSISWDGLTPTATFSVPDGSMTSDEIAKLFDEKISQRVLTYPSTTSTGVREHRVKYVLKEDNEYFFESSANNEEFSYQKVDINAPEVVNYLRANTLQSQYDTLKIMEGKNLDYSRYKIDFNKYGSEQTTIYLSEDSNFTTDVVKFQATDQSLLFENLIPSKNYYWKAIAKGSGEEFDGGQFEVNADNIRFGNYNRIGNMRDLGGWKVDEHHRIKYGYIVRGRNPDSINPAQKEQVTNDFNFKTQIDFRSDNDGGARVKISQNANIYYMNISQSYNASLDEDRYLNEKAGLVETPDEDNGKRLTYKQVYQKAFGLLANPNNYPVYFHCIHGADRTGTFAFLIEGLLGVGLDDITRDYELTSINSKSGVRTRRKDIGTGFEEPASSYVSSTNSFEMLTLLINQESGGTFKDKITNYLINHVGITQETINSIKNILIEEV